MAKAGDRAGRLRRMWVLVRTLPRRLRDRFSWKNLKRRDLWPRCWWYPPPPRLMDGTTEELLEAHSECSSTVRRTMLALLAFSLFCLVTTFGSFDSRLLSGAGTAEIKVPIANVPMAFVGFLIVAPLILIVLMIYLHVFFGYWLRLERSLGSGTSSAAKMPALFNLDHPAPRLFVWFIFYWLTPFVLGAITWKALGRPDYGIIIGGVTVLAALVSLWLQIRRNPETGARSLMNGFRWSGMVALCVLYGIHLITGASWLRRSMNLVRVDLQEKWLPDVDLRGADLRYAKLRGAKLRRARLQKADLSNAAMECIPPSNGFAKCTDLRGANLSGTVMHRVNLSGADLEAADARGADLGCEEGRNTDKGTKGRKAEPDCANLVNVNLQDTNFQGAILRAANLSDAELMRANMGCLRTREGSEKCTDLEHANLTSANLQGTNLKDAVLKNATLAGAEMTCVPTADKGMTCTNLSGADLRGAVLGCVKVQGRDDEGIPAGVSAVKSDERKKPGVLQAAEPAEKNTEKRCTDLSGAKLEGALMGCAVLAVEAGGRKKTKCTDLRGVQGLTCDRLTQAIHWQKAYRDTALACGERIPEPPSPGPAATNLQGISPAAR